MSTKAQATIDDLYQVADDGKAEIVDGELILMSPTGGLPAYAAGEIFASLREYARRTGRGYAFTDNVGFIVDLPQRRSFSPDAAFYLGELSGMKFLQGPPLLAVEVRSEGDYGPSAERSIRRKRADYFAAGTLVVWDVDLQGTNAVVRVFRAAGPNRDIPAVYGRGQFAEAEPALPGWTMPVDDLFA